MTLARDITRLRTMFCSSQHPESSCYCSKISKALWVESLKGASLPKKYQQNTWSSKSTQLPAETKTDINTYSTVPEDFLLFFCRWSCLATGTQFIKDL